MNKENLSLQSASSMLSNSIEMAKEEIELTKYQNEFANQEFNKRLNLMKTVYDMQAPQRELEMAQKKAEMAKQLSTQETIEDAP